MRRRFLTTLFALGPMVLVVALILIIWAVRSTAIIAHGCNAWHILNDWETDFNAGDTHFSVIAGLSEDDVWFGGTLIDGDKDKLALVHWDGKRASMAHTPLLEASYVRIHQINFEGPNNGWAIGEYTAEERPRHVLVDRPFTAHWDGTTWTIFPVPSSVTTPWGDVAPLTSHTAPESNSYTQLLAVDSIAHDNAWAVGFYSVNRPDFQPLILHWDGTAWDSIDAPTVGELNAVVGNASDDVWAFGNLKGSGNALHWNGRSWSIADAPILLNRVTDAVVSPSGDIALLGRVNTYSQNLGSDDVFVPTSLRIAVKAHDSEDWRQVNIPELELEPEITGIAATAEGDIWIAGYFPPNYGIDYFPSPRREARPMIWHWDGHTWDEMPSPNQADKRMLADIALAAKGNIWVVEAGGRQGEEGREVTPGMVAHYVECTDIDSETNPTGDARR